MARGDRKCAGCGNLILESFSENQLYCFNCWKKVMVKDQSIYGVKVTKKLINDKKQIFINEKGGQMKNKHKESIAQEILVFLESKNIESKDMTKVLMCAYKLAKKRQVKAN